MEGTKKPEETLFPEVVERPVTWDHHGYPRKADRYKAIVDTKTSKLFSIVSKNYKLLRHEDVIHEAEKAIFKLPDIGGYNTTTEFYNDGGRMRRTYRFTEKMAEIQEGDYVNPELHLYNSYDLTWPFTVILGAFRLVCTNGLVVGRKFLHIKKRHVFELGNSDIPIQISTALERFDKQTKEWEMWARRRLTREAYKKTFDVMQFGKKATEEVEARMVQEAEDCDDKGFPIITLWVFFNILTWYITRRAASLNHRVEMERRLRTAIGHFKGERS